MCSYRILLTLMTLCDLARYVVLFGNLEAAADHQRTISANVKKKGHLSSRRQVGNDTAVTNAVNQPSRSAQSEKTSLFDQNPTFLAATA